jgi:hypothetical protein
MWKERSYWRNKLREAISEKQQHLNRSMEQFDALLHAKSDTI